MSKEGVYTQEQQTFLLILPTLNTAKKNIPENQQLIKKFTVDESLEEDPNERHSRTTGIKKKIVQGARTAFQKKISK